MYLRIIARSRNGKFAYAEEVKSIKPITINPFSLLRDPVEYIDRHGGCWNCEASDIIDSNTVKATPVICKGVYKLEF